MIRGRQHVGLTMLGPAVNISLVIIAKCGGRGHWSMDMTLIIE